MTTLLAPGRRALALLALLTLGTPVARAQEPDPEPLRLIAVAAGGVRNSVTENWGTVRLEVTNVGAEPRDARVAVFFSDQPDVQFTRDVFLPPRTVVATWMTLGPAPDQRGPPHATSRRCCTTDRRKRTPRTPGGGTSRPVAAAVLPPPRADDGRPPRSPEPTAPPCGFRRAGNAHPKMRELIGLSEYVVAIPERFLPPAPEAFEGIDLLVLAGNQLAADPAGARSLRRWVQQGGTLWVMLDRVDPATVAPLLGDDLDIQVIDRVGLTTVRLHRSIDQPGDAEARDHDLPVELVRVVPGARDTIIHAANGWPASFTSVCGRGRVVFTPLGSPARVPAASRPGSGVARDPQSTRWFRGRSAPG